MDFDAIDGQPSKIFFLIVTPEAESEPHIQLLAEISKLSKNKEKLNELLNATSPEEVISIIKRKTPVKLPI